MLRTMTRAITRRMPGSQSASLDGDLQEYQGRIRLTIRLTDTEKGNSVVWSNC